MFWLGLGFTHVVASDSEMETGGISDLVEILRPAGQAGWNTGQILLSCN